MVTGRKAGNPAKEIASDRPLWAMGLVAVGAAWIVALFANHDPQTATVKLPLLPTVVQLGEGGAHSGKSDAEKSLRHHHGADDDDD